GVNSYAHSFPTRRSSDLQILVEGLALAAFGLMYNTTQEPLIKQITQYIMADEARHVAFGVLSLRDIYPQMTEGERKEREEFTIRSEEHTSELQSPCNLVC